MSFPRSVIGFHGCTKSRADALLSGRMAISDWPVSNNRWEWLGGGIYFWEHAPRRALQWAQERVKGTKQKPAVVGAIIMLSDVNVLDLTDVQFGPALRNAHRELADLYRAAGKTLPKNRDKLRDLDCLVINTLCDANPGLYGAVRAAFPEGDPIFPGSALQEQTHLQIAVRDAKVITGIFKPVL